MAPLPPVPKTEPRFFPGNRGEVRQGEGHEHAFMKETAPASIAVVSIGFRRAGLSPWPYTATPMQLAWGEKAAGFGHRRQEEGNTKVEKGCHPLLASTKPPPPPVPPRWQATTMVKWHHTASQHGLGGRPCWPATPPWPQRLPRHRRASELRPAQAQPGPDRARPPRAANGR
jgi:hypothetical protein